VRLREMAIKKGMKINEWGVYKIKGEKEEKVAGDTEESVYAAMGLAWMPPEMRENHGELDWALEHFKIENRKSKIENNFIQVSDMRGDLHMHTTASDGACSIEEMVAEAKRRGYQYIAITDHSKSQFQANGLKADRLIEHIAAIHAVAKNAAKSGMLVLAGSEVDILADGSLDYEDDLLEKLDWVVASPHAALTQESDPATQRLIRAISNPHVCVIGHPTGRLVPTRRGLEPDMEKVIFAAARNGVALEINAHYYRLDLRDTHARLAVKAGVPLCINTDAHGLGDFDMMKYGIVTARRAWAKPENVLNAWPLEQLKKWLKGRKEMASF
jgi:DNA polymerase (family 10)